MKKIHYAVLLIAGLIINIANAEDRGGTAPEFIWRDVGTVKWRFCGNAKIVGDELVCIADEKNRNAYAVGECDFSAYDGKPLQMQVVASTENVTRSSKNYLGFRVMLSYLDLDMGGNRVWPNGGALYGTQSPTEVVWRDINPKRRGACEIQLGLHDCTGRAVYNLKTLQARATTPLVPKVNAGYKIKYPESVRNAPRGRGVMLGGMNDAAWDELKSWGVNLVRHQISVGGTGPATNHAVYIAGYMKNYDRCLDELEKRLVAARKRGIRVCIDQHSSPGGRCDAGDRFDWCGDCRMFHDPVYARLFIDCWVKLVKRMTPYRDTIYGYDLINEACHNAPALPDGDIVNLQRRCAEAIRAVDPDTPIILESMYCDPTWFARMSAIKMDNVIYQVHLYYPHDYTHQGILNDATRVEWWPDAKKGWNRDFLRRSLKPVIDFQKEHDAKMFVGEFSVIAWAPNAEEYMRDCMTIFEELGWDWTFHAYREFDGWSVQRESTSRGIGSEHFRISTSNPRMRTLKEGLKGGFLPGKPAVDYKSRAFKRVMISGNSITCHGPNSKIGWTNCWGMAASCPEKDYVHLVLRGLECHGGVKPEYRQIHMPLEQGTTNTAQLAKLCSEYTAWKPDLVIFAHGENQRALTNEANWAICKASYAQAARAFQSVGATVVLRAPYWPNGRYAKMLREVADETGAIAVDIGDLGRKKGMSATGLFWHGGVAMHPGDNGMIAIADRLLTAIYERQYVNEEKQKCCASRAVAAPVRLAVFGGAQGCVSASGAAKACWKREMPCTWDDYGRATGKSDMSEQVRQAFASGRSYDMFVFWCGSDATASDFATAVELVRTNAPSGEVLLFTPAAHPSRRGVAPTSEQLAKIVQIAGAKNVATLDLYRDVTFPSPADAHCSTSGDTLTAAGYAFIGDIQAKYLRYIHSVGWGTEPALKQDPSDRMRVARRTRRLHEAKWGVFNHYLGHGIRSAAEWKKKVDSYDVRKVADQLESCGARFYFITLMQGRRWMCAPNATYDRIAGTKPGEACSTRDLPMELSEELAKRGIDLYLYYTGDGPYIDKEIGPRFGFTEPRFLGVTRPFVDKWAAVLEEYATRYGSRVKGWWIDGCYASYLRYTTELLESYERAVHKGNPDAAVAFNDGVEDYFVRYTRLSDFTAGEFNDFYCVPKERFVKGAQAFALIPLGAWGANNSPSWGGRGFKRSADYVADYVRLVNANGGVVAIDVAVAEDGAWRPEQIEVLKTVGRRTGTLKQ